MNKKSTDLTAKLTMHRSPEDEKKHAWLTMLLDAFEVIDRGISLTLQREKRKSGRKAACRELCDGCCRSNTDIPVYPLEMAGIYWYITEKLDQTEQKGLTEPLIQHTPSSPCPFLIERRCKIYPVRPIACRQYIVFGRPCAENEDPYRDRREDLLLPVQEFTNQAFTIMLPFYGITGEAEKAAAIRNRIIHARAQNLQSVDWKPLAERILTVSK